MIMPIGLIREIVCLISATLIFVVRMYIVCESTDREIEKESHLIGLVPFMYRNYKV